MIIIIILLSIYVLSKNWDVNIFMVICLTSIVYKKRKLPRENFDGKKDKKSL